MKQDDVREKIEKIMEKHTVALTKTGVDPEIVSFDTVVLNQYDATNDLIELFNSHSTSLLQKMEKIIKEEAKGLQRDHIDESDQKLWGQEYKIDDQLKADTWNRALGYLSQRIIEAVKG